MRALVVAAFLLSTAALAQDDADDACVCPDDASTALIKHGPIGILCLFLSIACAKLYVDARGERVEARTERERYFAAYLAQALRDAGVPPTRSRK